MKERTFEFGKACLNRMLGKVVPVSLGLAMVFAINVNSSQAKDLVFGYVTGSMIYPYNVATATGFEEAAKEAGAKAFTLDPQSDVEKQSNAIDDLIAQGVDGIGFLPLDSVVAESIVDRVASHHIPIVSVAVQVGDPAKRELRDVYPSLDALVAPDDVIQGEQAGKLAITLLPKDKTAKIGIIEGAPGYACVEQRTTGFKKALDQAGTNYEIVGTQPTNWTPEKGEAVCQNFLTSNPDIDLIFSQADDMAIGCARAIQAVDSKAKLVSTSGGSKLGNAAIKVGEIDGSVCMRPQMLGRLMFQELYESVTNPKSKKGRFVTLEVPILTKENVDQYPAEW